MAGSTSKDFIVNVLGDTSNADKNMKAFGNRTGKVFDGIKSNLGSSSRAFGGFRTVVGGALAAIGISRVGSEVEQFLTGSIGAYQEAEAAQLKLTDAYARFPAVANMNIEQLRAWNSESALKTRFDDDAYAAAEATLAQYKLTGTQIAALTPLVADYAAKTGTDLVSASGAIGKAMFGQGRALKSVGINFVDAKSVAGNYERVMHGLRATVAGYAEKEATQGAGKTELMKNKLGEAQEMLGEKFLPIWQETTDYLVTTAIPALTSVVDWVSKNQDIVGAVAIGLGVFAAAWLALSIAQSVATAAQWAFNIAAAANPIGLIIIAVVALIAIVVALVMNWDAVSKFFGEMWQNILNGGKVVIDWIVNAFLTFHPLGILIKNWGPITQFFSDIWTNVTTGIGNAVGWIINKIAQIGLGWHMMWNGFTGLVQDVFKNVANFVAGGINMVIDLVNGAIGGINALGSAASDVTGGTISWAVAEIPHIPMLAAGGIVTKATTVIAGEGRESEAIIPLSKLNGMLTDARSSASAGGKGGTSAEIHEHVHLDIPAGFVGSPDDLGRTLMQLLKEAKRRGTVPLKEFKDLANA